MTVPVGVLLRWQFDLTWELFEYHLQRLEPTDFLWEPAAHCWTLRPGSDGGWTPDWADTEPDPVPVPTVGWLVWHIGWWWTAAVDQLQGRPVRPHTDVDWPGIGEPALIWLRDLCTRWREQLDAPTAVDLDRAVSFPWPDGSGYTVAHLAAWVNAELMKNAAEIGQLRLLRAAGAPGCQEGPLPLPGPIGRDPS